jgi:hypothetical protein
LKLTYAEFYITNHCNIDCDGCNRFNNFKYSGSEDWENYRSVYKEWASILDIKHIAILGGEPLLHKNLDNIISDIRSFWPDCNLEITTNGLLIEKIKPNVVESLKNNNVQIYCSIHKPEWVDQIKESVIAKFGDLKLINKKRILPNNPAGSDTFISNAGNKIILEYTYFFRQPAIIKTNNNKFTLHSSNYKIAHSQCDMKKSHHFSKGNLYKCGLMLTLPQIIQQKPNMFDINDTQLKLLNSYSPITLEKLKSNPEIIDELSLPLLQCEFCPEKYNYKKIFNT